MKTKVILLVIFVVTSLSAFGQQSKAPSQKDGAQSQTVMISVLQDSIVKLQAQNRDMQKQLADLEKEVQLYREDVRHSIDDYNNKMSLWMTVLGFIIAVFGIIIPYFMNKNNERLVEKMIEDARTQAERAETALNKIQPQVITATEQAERAETALNKIQPQVITATEQAQKSEDALNTIEQKIETVKEQAQLAQNLANETMASIFFTRGLNESDYNQAIRFFSLAIKHRPDFAAAYTSRAYKKKFLNDFKGAIKDFTEAIQLQPDYSKAYKGRAECYKKLAEEEKDPQKKAEYANNVKDDELKNNSLNKEG
jgi:tetratricopeptide (TPR) repeat protein